MSQSYQTHRQKVHRFRAWSLDLDKRLYTLLRATDSPKVSIASCEGQLRLRLTLGDYQRSWRQHETRAAKLIYRKATKETQWIKNHLQQITRKFVQSLRADEYVVLEALTHIRQRAKQRHDYRNRFHSWAFAKLQGLIAYKCAERGLAVLYVDPAYTSQRCPRCGRIDKRNRRSQALFRCVHCGFQHNADTVAATNLREQAQGIWAPVSAPIAAGDDPKGTVVQLRRSRAASSETLARSN